MNEGKIHRNSKQRTSILELLKHTKAHPTAQEIFDALREDFPHLSLGTVYRNLNILVEQDQIRKLQYGSTFDRFDGNAVPHYHFICESCGRVYDLDIGPFRELQNAATEQCDHTVLSHKIDFFGICTDCREKDSIHEGTSTSPVGEAVTLEKN
ncbi:MAG TPA: transcriptional repressor [Sediminispirochaeta sp.]|nr:transcriptional repressor [Sediminispirochaeta sp.]